MASACVNNIPTTSAATYTSYGWLSPRVSLSRDYKEEECKISKSSSPEKLSDLESSKDAGDFEFRLGDNATMLPADELFSDGKLVPLQFYSAKTAPPPPSTQPEEKSCRSINEDPYMFSPKAPRCSSRWRELLGLKKLSQNNNSQQPKTTPSALSTSSSSSSKSIRLFLNRNSKTVSSSTSGDSSSLSLPLLKDSSSSSSSLDFESISISSSRLSLSSSSSGHDHDELPRASLDAEKPNTQHHRRSLSSGPKVRTRPRMGRNPMRKETTTRARGVSLSVDSPRMNPSGKVVFQSLERSSSSPSSFNGGPRYKHNNRGVMERSYSANVHVRITPVLNVPVCTLRGSSKSGVFGFAQLFSSSCSQSQKKEGNINGNTRSHHQYHHHTCSIKNKKEDEKESF